MKARDFFDLNQEKASPGEVVKALRKNFQITQQELADVTGIAEGNLSAIENGKVEIGVKRAVLIAAVFGIDPSLILFSGGYEGPYVKAVKAVRQASAKLMEKKKVG